MSNNILNKTYRCKITLRIKDKTRDDKKYQAEPFVIFYRQFDRLKKISLLNPFKLLKFRGIFFILFAYFYGQTWINMI